MELTYFGCAFDVLGVAADEGGALLVGGGRHFGCCVGSGRYVCAW